MTKKSKSKKPFRWEDVRLRVMAEYDSSGIWLIGQVGPFRHGGIDYSFLNLPPALSEGFRQWITHYWAALFETYPDIKDDYPELKNYRYSPEVFNAEGRALAFALKAHVGPDCYVEFVPENDENGVGLPEVITTIQRANNEQSRDTETESR